VTISSGLLDPDLGERFLIAVFTTALIAMVLGATWVRRRRGSRR
jgi:hypothetical protein